MKNMEESLEILLEQGNTIQIKPRGYSMYPMFVPGRDWAIIKQADLSCLKPNDVILYRRDEGILVLHRIYSIKKNGIYLVGDNQEQIEGPIRMDQVKGILTAFIRKGRTRSVKHMGYRLASRLWLFALPFRYPFKHFIKRVKILVIKVLPH